MLTTIDNLLARLLGPIDGYKTKIGSWLMAALAANQAMPFLSPGVATGLHYVSLALMGYGLRDAVAKSAPP